MNLDGGFDDMVSALFVRPSRYHSGPLRLIELYCGNDESRVDVGHLGFDVVFSHGTGEVEHSSANEGIPRPDLLPKHDLLLGVFSGQDVPLIHEDIPTFQETTCFSKAARILRTSRRPEGVVFINGPELAANQDGQTLELVLSDIRKFGYSVDHAVLPLFDIGTVTSGNSTVIVATLHRTDGFPWPSALSARDIVETVAAIVETRVRPPSKQAVR